jgi:hypothetical protein
MVKKMKLLGNMESIDGGLSTWYPDRQRFAQMI